MTRVVHLLSGLQVGGKERAALRLAARGLQEHDDHRLLLFDSPFRSADLDFDPGPVPTQFLPRRTGIDLRFARHIARTLSQARVDTVHAHNDTALFYGAVATAFQGRHASRLVSTFHTWPSHATLAARLLTRLAAYRAAAVAAVSDELAARLIEHGWIGRCMTVWNGVDLEAFRPDGPTDGWRCRLELSPDAFLVGHVARFDSVKRHVDLIAAARLLWEKIPTTVFALVGHGPLHDAIQRSVGDDRRIRFIPQIDNIAAFLRSLDLFVLCSTDEGAPLSLLEAMACGRAAVCTAVGGMPAILSGTDGEASGLLVPPLQPASLAEAIGNLLRRPEDRLRLGVRARARAAKFSFDREWDTYRRLYAGEEPGRLSGRAA